MNGLESDSHVALFKSDENKQRKKKDKRNGLDGRKRWLPFFFSFFLFRYYFIMWTDQISHVHGHLFNLRAVELLNVLQRAHVLGGQEVDGNTLAAKAAAATDPVAGKGAGGE
jgi:hypothetical protein